MILSLTSSERDAYIMNHLPIKQTEKEKYGEVFTHPEFIRKIFGLFPRDAYSNPQLKWFEPTAGVGNFIIILYELLMDGLTAWEPDEGKRSDHIIENMLYMNELSQTNCDIAKTIFGDKANITCADFLSEKCPRTNKFDCIIGNLPFQHNYGKTSTGARILGGKNKLYEQIFLKSFDILNPDGFLSFIVPDAIFSGNNNASYNILLQNSVPFISFNSSNQKYFPKIQQTICYFIMKKTGRTETIIENNNEVFTTTLQNRIINPIQNWNSHTDTLIDKYVSTKRNCVIYNRGKNLSAYNGSLYPLIYTHTKTLYTDNELLARGLHIKKAVIFAISPDLKFKMDWTGDFGVGPNTFYIPFVSSDEGIGVETLLNSENYKLLALSTKSSRQYLKIAFIEHLKLHTY